MIKPALKYTKAADAWKFEIQVHDSHDFGEPTIEEFTFVGTRYTATCKRCGKLFFVSGGWGGPAAFGPAANQVCGEQR